MSFLRYGQFEWVMYSKCGLTNELYRRMRISFVRRQNGLVMRYNIPLALLAAVRKFAEGVDAEFTTIPRPLIRSYFCFDSPPSFSGRVKRKLGEPPIDW